uniref:recombinase family protein n=1 Tax=Microbacterium sp. CPCC 204701 TaxID=2493084 RepID=UPI00197C3A6D|nr:recombinase family protein [Microbacterium sp. CPCC 204701]
MNGILIGYARVSTADQDLTSQRDALLRLGVLDSNIYVDHGLTGTNRARPGLREALAAVREGDTLVVTKLDRLARSVKDARDIADELTTKGVALSLGGNRYDPTDPVGRLLFNVLAMAAAWHSSPPGKHVSFEPASSWQRPRPIRNRVTDRVGSEVP